MNVYDEMLASYSAGGDSGKLQNAKYEVAQQITLAGLRRGGFFDKAAFYGGTCLRLFHGLRRFSEDMDFTLLRSDPGFNFENYFQPVIDEFRGAGRTVEIKKKEKRTFGKVESAFLKDTTDVYNISFQTEKTVKVKIETDTQPPSHFNTEQLSLSMPYPFFVRCVCLPDLFAGKMHALVFRNWKSRVKGRDWYDFDWYVSHNVKLDFRHLQQRILDFNGENLSREEFHSRLIERLSSVNISDIKEDVIRFVDDPRVLDFWSTDYFLAQADRIIYENDQPKSNLNP